MSTKESNTPHWMRWEASIALVLAISSILGGLIEGLSWTIIGVVALATMALVPLALDRYGPPILNALSRKGWLPKRMEALIENGGQKQRISSNKATHDSSQSDVDLSKLIVREKILSEANDTITAAFKVVARESEILSKYFHDDGPLEQHNPSKTKEWERALMDISQAHRNAFGSAPNLLLHNPYHQSPHPLQHYEFSDEPPARACRLFWDQMHEFTKQGPLVVRRIRQDLEEVRDKMNRLSRY